MFTLRQYFSENHRILIKLNINSKIHEKFEKSEILYGEDITRKA